MWTFLTARPDGSLSFLNDSSHSKAVAVLQATERSDGTLRAADAEGK